MAAARLGEDMMTTHGPRTWTLLWLALLLGGLTLSATGKEPASAPPPASDAPDLDPCRAEIRDYRAQAAQRLATLQANYAEAADRDEKVRLEAEIRDLKLGTQLGILAIQIRYAQAEGDTTLATRLEAAVGKLKARPVTGRPVPRTEVRPPADQR